MTYRIRIIRNVVLLTALTAVLCNAAQKPQVKVMTRNMDAGTDLGFVFAATDLASFAQGTAATLAEIRASGIPERAAKLADEIAAQQPDLIALQEVTLWRTGKLLKPPASEILFDQLDLLLSELAKRKLRYGVVAIQTMSDVEAPVPADNLNLRFTDRDAIPARIDLPQSELDFTNVETHRYNSTFVFGSQALGQVPVLRGWMSVEATVRGMTLRFINTHLESPIPGIPAAEKIQVDQANELIAAVARTPLPVLMCGDFNANAEVGQDHTATTQNILAAGFTDAWHTVHSKDPGFTWPFFGEDQQAGPATPFERIDLTFARGLTVADSERTGTDRPASGPWASDHAGVVATLSSDK